jgi:hypothetical protein
MLDGLQVDAVRRGVFEANLRSGERRQHGVGIHLQRRPFRVPAERPDELITREDLRERIWGLETVVDFDHSTGTAVRKPLLAWRQWLEPAPHLKSMDSWAVIIRVCSSRSL